MLKRMTLQEMIDERHEIVEKIRIAISAENMDMKAYAKLNERYYWLDGKIRKKDNSQK